MRNWVRRVVTTLVVALVALSSVASLFVGGRIAQASELDDAVTQTTAAYEQAQSELAEIESRIEENEARLAELEEQLPAQQDVTAAAISAHYKLQQDSQSLLVLLLSSESFSDFISVLFYLDVITARNTQAIDNLLAMEEELTSLQEELETDRAEAEAKVVEAQEALQAAQDAVAAQAAAEEAEAQAALEAALEAAQQQTSSTTASGNTFTVEVPESSTPDAVEWSSDKETFVAEWTARIDAYLAGSPLAGYGATFAEAAWDYGVDPRWSPAIACIESSKGLYCFASHNAWGWGSASWPDWETAIREHVAGLASGYGYTITVAAAQKYCPPNWEHWYASVLSEMERI